MSKEDDKKSKIKDLLERAGKKDVETRVFPAELRVARKEDGALPKIEGYAAIFNSDSEDMGFVERIKPGAFKGALKISDARALFNHDANYILGRQSNNTLKLKEDKKGLFMSVQPPDTQLVRDMILTPIERGDINQQSFGFTIEADSWDGLDTDKPTRTIEKVRELFDVSPVTFPAYQDTDVALRSLAAAKEKTPKPTDEKKPETIIILLKDDETTEQFDFTGDERFKKAADKINSLRSELNPTIPNSDNTDGVPTNKKTSDTVEAEQDDTLERINKTIERLEK